MKRRILPWALIILWMAVIFAFSHQPATESSQLSSDITHKIADVISIIVPDINDNQESLHSFIRKSAHFSVYFILGILVANGLSDNNMSKLKIILLAFLVCILYAVSDEIHQLYIPGRSGQVSDVLLDSAGGLVGVLLYIFIRRDRRVKETGY